MTDDKLEAKIRRATPDDGDAVARIFSDASVFGQMLQLPFPTGTSWRERFTTQDGVVSLIACSGTEVIGLASLHLNLKTPRRSHCGSIGMGVAAPWQGKGVGSALVGALLEMADNWYGLSRIELTVYVDNEAAIGLYKKFGFELEGTLRKYALRDGALVDTYTMARIRDRPR